MSIAADATSATVGILARRRGFEEHASFGKDAGPTTSGVFDTRALIPSSFFSFGPRHSGRFCDRSCFWKYPGAWLRRRRCRAQGAVPAKSLCAPPPPGCQRMPRPFPPTQIQPAGPPRLPVRCRWSAATLDQVAEFSHVSGPAIRPQRAMTPAEPPHRQRVTLGEHRLKWSASSRDLVRRRSGGTVMVATQPDGTDRGETARPPLPIAGRGW